MTLRRSLLIVVAGLTVAALLIVTATAVLGMRQYLLNRTDEQLAAAAVLARSRTELLVGDPEMRGEAIRQVVSVTDYVVEIRTAGAGTIRVVSGAPLPARPLLDQASAAGEEPQNVAGYRAVITHDGDYTVLVALSLQPLRDTVQRLLLVAGVTSLIVLALLMLIARLLIARRLRPLDAITATATDIAGGDLVRPVPSLAGPRTEVGRLTSAINKMLAQIQEAIGAWQRSESRMRSFVADASHELRTPVTSIQGYAQLIRTGVVDVRERPDVLRRLEEEATRMGTLVNALLYLAQLDASPELRRAPVDLARLARDAVADASAVEPDRPLSAETPAECVVTGDEDSLRQVLANLLANVRAHTPPGAAAVVRVGPTPDGRFVRVEVTDEGPGMDAKTARHAFERFWRADRGRTAGGGAGLGLAIVADVVASHGGKAGIDGSTVWFTLPRDS
ncbi:sensor histidine kinase [Paractinoplanes brasiliensis]|uniref:histidine kinase n=1 Tax=Paractinoplanes brasiliensis TaxID=52695 RepID=A0A4R6K139_9ACTN|nr:HAMP domain-containing sensor histidine kinase [Actinoplanes brasiliensis]TDO41982.1 two-component system OmpR family sensor kinase [Actinoplanes brasiliensis]GID29737.1 two-component sensor histidine kinase [Actinoplanes brasiliensis]